MAHLGSRIVDAEGGLVFRSWFSAERLRRLSASRARTWAVTPPGALRPLSLEDYYLTEATTHVQRRNQALQKRNLRVAWGEERILERWYAPVLRLRGLGSGRPMALGRRQRERLVRARQAGGGGVYRSPALSRRVFLEPRPSTLWWTAGGLAAAVLLAGVGPLRRAS